MASAGWRFLGIVGFFCLAGAFGAAWVAADKCSHTEDCNGYRASYYKAPDGGSQELSHSETTEELVAAYTFWLTVFTGGLFTATTGLWLATFRLWRTTAEAVAGGEKAAQAAIDAVSATNRHADASAALVSVTKDAAERQLRAYVFTRVVNASRDINSVEKFGVTYTGYNSGQTPAYLIEIARAVDVFPYPLPSNFNLPTPVNISGGNVIGPRDGFDAGHINADRLFALEEVAAICAFNPKIRIYYYGWIIYEDAFSEKRRTDFCWSLVYASTYIASDGKPHSTWDATEGRNRFT